MGNYFQSCSCFQGNDDEIMQSKTCFIGQVGVPSQIPSDSYLFNTIIDFNKLSIPNDLDPLRGFVTVCLKSLNELERAQRMLKTKCGLPVNQETTSNVLTNAQVDHIRNNPAASEDIRKIMSSPFKEISRITDNIFLTGVAGLTIENFKNLRINIIINTTYEYPMINRPDIVSIRIPVDDDWTDNMEVYLNDIADFLSMATYQNWRIVIHCAAGASRSTTVVLAYLIKWYNLTLREAFAYVHAARECARPNMGFFEKLIQFDRIFHPDSDAQMLEITIQGALVKVPNFYKTDYPNLYSIEINKQLRNQGINFQITDPNVNSVNQFKHLLKQQFKFTKKKQIYKQNSSMQKMRKTSIIKRNVTTYSTQSSIGTAVTKL